MAAANTSTGVVSGNSIGNSPEAMKNAMWKATRDSETALPIQEICSNLEENQSQEVQNTQAPIGSLQSLFSLKFLTISLDTGCPMILVQKEVTQKIGKLLLFHKE